MTLGRNGVNEAVRDCIDWEIRSELPRFWAIRELVDAKKHEKANYV